MANEHDATGITDQATPEVVAEVAGYRDKLIEMTGGKSRAAGLTHMEKPPAHAAGARRAHESRTGTNDSDVPDGRAPSKGSSTQATAPPGEERRLALTKELVSGKLTAAERESRSRELRGLLASMATPEEQQALEGATLQDHRAAFDLAPPDLPPSALADYEESFSDWERDFLLAARQDGLPSDLVRDIRNAGIRLGMQVDGKPLADEVVDGVLKRYSGRLTATQVKALKAYWRRIEGGAA